jgi:hypothetical protein
VLHGAHAATLQQMAGTTGPHNTHQGLWGGGGGGQGNTQQQSCGTQMHRDSVVTEARRGQVMPARTRLLAPYSSPSHTLPAPPHTHTQHLPACLPSNKQTPVVRTSLLSTRLSENHLASRDRGSAPPGADADATPAAAMLAAVTAAGAGAAAPLPLAVPFASADPLASGADPLASAAGAGAGGGRLPMDGHCTPARATVTGVRSGTRDRRRVEPLSTASTMPAAVKDTQNMLCT